MLVPMYLLIAIWGHEGKAYASMKFFIFTQLSGLLMLVAILVLVKLHHSATGIVSFSYFDLAFRFTHGCLMHIRKHQLRAV